MFETLVKQLDEISCQKPFLQEKRKESIDHYPIASMGLLWQRNNAIQCKANIRSSAPIVWVWLWEYKKTFKPPGVFLVETNQNHKLVIAVHGLIYTFLGGDGFIPFALIPGRKKGVLNKPCFFFLNKGKAKTKDTSFFVHLMERYQTFFKSWMATSPKNANPSHG